MYLAEARACARADNFQQRSRPCSRAGFCDGRNMKSLFCILAIILCSSVVFGQKESDKKTDKITNKQISKLPQVKNSKPPIELQKALKIMEKFIKKQKIDTSNYYLARVNMIQYGAKNDRKPAWYFRWVKIDESIGDYIEIAVFMDGRAERMPSM
jgi:hypothetical protein